MPANAQLWRPSAQRIADAELSRFVARYLPGADYARLHAWSLAEPEQFWRAVWEFCELQGTLGERVYDPGQDIATARYLPEARLNYAENLLAKGAADKAAIVFEGEHGQRVELTYAQLRDQVARLQGYLRAAGVGEGDRVAGIVANTPEAIVAMLATSSLGAIWSSCSPDFGAAAIVDRLGQVQPRVVVACNGYYYNGRHIDVRPKLAEVAAELDQLRTLVVYRYAGDDCDLAAGDVEVAGWEQIMAAGESPQLGFARLPALAPGFILFSSGTTGRPKCIAHSCGGLLLKHVCELSLHVDVKPADRLFYFTTCGWMMWNWQVSALALGATVVIYDGSPMHPAPGRLAELAWREQVSHFGASAKYFSACAKAGVAPLRELGGPMPRTVLSTGSPLLDDSFDYLYESWGVDLHVASISGGTDICACFVGGVPTLPVARGRIQAAELGCDVAAVDDRGQPVVGTPGELVCRNAIPSMPLGFWGQPDDSRYRQAYFARHPGVWSHGDWASFFADGSLVISGRSDATLNPGGVRIGTAEIYRQVESFAEVQEAAAIGQQWEGDQRVVLFLRLADGVALDDDLERRLREAIRKNASPRHVPARIVAVDDIPRTRSGKIVELAIAAAVHGRAIANADALANPEALEQFRDLEQLRD